MVLFRVEGSIWLFSGEKLEKRYIPDTRLVEELRSNRNNGHMNRKRGQKKVDFEIAEVADGKFI